MLTEESADDHSRLESTRCWIVDPIDGTQQFIDRTGEFDILIALVVNHRPVVGVTYQPTTGLLLSAVAGGGAWVERAGHRDQIQLEPAGNPPRLLTSKWLGAPMSLPFLNRAAARLGSPPPEVSQLGIYARSFVPPDNTYDALIGISLTGQDTMGAEWDVACADLIVHEAGGHMTDLFGHPFRYNKSDPRNYGGLVLAVDPATHGRVLNAIQAEREADTSSSI
jgi:3'-phosphoadenosine 5'-phosphosulfate (PAPS) 3'-phosphatase